ncbi:MAG TPA: hypothetical protein VNK23_12310 [Candidatus Dormibacteraeota bacterium]|nr:hypothetical protein [Candidatus Dormibacteraeota bacterium]
MTVALYLHDSNKPVPADLALTGNVSAHGARIVTKRAGNPGEEWQVAAISNGIRHDARVIYCIALSKQNFCIGLELEQPVQNWWDGCHELRKHGRSANAVESHQTIR